MAGGLQPPSEEDERRQSAAKRQGVIFVLENASLEVARVGKVRVLRLSRHTGPLLGIAWAISDSVSLALHMNSQTKSYVAQLTSSAL